MNTDARRAPTDEDDNDDEDWIDNLIIIAMCALVGWMVYVRQFRMEMVEIPEGRDEGPPPPPPATMPPNVQEEAQAEPEDDTI
jgi:hypothetical protein